MRLKMTYKVPQIACVSAFQPCEVEQFALCAEPYVSSAFSSPVVVTIMTTSKLTTA